MSLLLRFPPETIIMLVLFGVIILLANLGRYGSGE